MIIQKKKQAKAKLLKKSIEKRRTSREHSSTINADKEFEKFRRNLINKRKQKEQSLKQHRSYIEQELQMKKKLNMFRYLDQKENLKREKYFLTKFADRIVQKHKAIDLVVDREKEKERVIEELRRK